MNLQPMFESVQRACIIMYTSEWKYASVQVDVKSFNWLVNCALYNDNYEQLKLLLPIILIINDYLRNDTNKNHEHTAVMYCGATLNDSVIAKFIAAEKFRFATYLSTSSKMEQAVKCAEWSYMKHQLKSTYACRTLFQSHFQTPST